MKLIIDRSKWLRGEGTTHSALLRKSDKKMCCLGFLALACGIPRNQILDTTSPASSQLLVDNNSKWPAFLLSKAFSDSNVNINSPAAGYLMIINDSIGTSAGHREKRLTEIFAEYDIKVEFVDGEKKVARRNVKRLAIKSRSKVV